jgi:hypothetical protein
MSSGPTYKPIKVLVYEFVPSKQDFLRLSYVKNSSRNDSPEFAPSYAPPLGLYNPSVKTLREKCLIHIDSIISEERNPGEFSCGDTSIISWRAFEAVNLYRRTSKKIEQQVSRATRNACYYSLNNLPRILCYRRQSCSTQYIIF